MESVFFVEQGSYSDYHVVGVFSTQERADAVCRAINEVEKGQQYLDEAEVVERALDGLPEVWNAGLAMYAVEMERDGTPSKVELTAPDYPCHSLMQNQRWTPENPGSWKMDVANVPPFLVTTMWARDPHHAVKIANERRAAIVAANLWRMPEPRTGREDFEAYHAEFAEVLKGVQEGT